MGADDVARRAVVHPRRAFAHRGLTCAVIATLAAMTGCVAQPLPTPGDSISAHVDAVLGALDGGDDVRAVLVHQRGEPVYERYLRSTAADTWDVRSVTKSVTSTLVGIAIDQGLISGVDATLGELLPAHADDLTPEAAGIRLHSILTHTANFPAARDEPALPGQDWVAAILADRGERGPGDGSFVYSDVGSHVLAAVVAQATGMSPLAYARATLFDPLGIDADPAWEERLTADADVESYLREYGEAEVAWPADPEGVNLGSTLLRLRPSDLMRLGQLFADEGDRQGEQIVSSSWVTTATSPLVATTEYGAPRYGYQWWVDEERGAFFAQGLGGTVIAVDPATDGVVVIASEIAPDDTRGIDGMTTPSAVALALALLDELPARSRS